jgi:hemolysin activation/secretion protein
MRQSHVQVGRFVALFSGLLIVFFSIISNAYAQGNGFVPPDAGSLLQGIERSLPAPKIPEVKAPTPPPQIGLLKGQGETLIVKRILFEGNLALKSMELEKAAATYLERPLTFADLQNLAAQIALLYRERGLIATVSIPHQIVVRGIVRLKVVEARFSGAVMDDNSTGNLNNAFILNRIETALKPGELVDVYKLDRAILLLNDLPGTSVTGGLDSGSQEGESRYIALSERRDRFSVNASVDNQGARSTGTTRLNSDININNTLGVGDLISANAMHTDGSDYGRFAV